MTQENAIQTYESADFGSIRAIEEGGEVWFVAADVAKALGYRSAADMTRTLDDDEKGYATMRTPGGEQQVSTVNEYGLYRACVARKVGHIKNEGMRANVERFQRWITHEVIPSIRRHGAYVNPAGAETPEELIARALTAAHEIIARREARIKALEDEAEELKPKAAFANAVAGSDTSILIRDLAKLLTENGYPIGQNGLFDRLRDDGYLIRANGRDRNHPTQRSMEQGLMEMRETVIHTPAGAHARITPLVTGKGQAYFLRRYAGVGAR